jgi:hypothetical protein
MAQAKPKAPIKKVAADNVAGGLPLTADMRKDPESFFPVFKHDDTLGILKNRGFHVFDDFDHHRKEIRKALGLHVKYAKLGINIPRRCFWVTYNFWKKRALLRKFLPPSLIRSLIDLTIEGKNDEMGGILCLRDMKTGKFFLGFGMFTRRKGFTTDNSVPARNVFRDYVALRETTPEVAEILKEALTWIVSHKKQLTQTYWEPIGEKLVEKRNAKL